MNCKGNNADSTPVSVIVNVVTVVQVVSSFEPSSVTVCEFPLKAVTLQTNLLRSASSSISLEVVELVIEVVLSEIIQSQNQKVECSGIY